VANPLLAYWLHILGRDGAPGRARRKVPDTSVAQESIAIFLIMRRMRTPLIVLIVIFAVSVVGLTLIPGQDAEGRPWRMGFFDAFYVMSYTASTIGFGEIPYPFTYGQRLWVTIAIYLTVIGWAYAIGSLLALLQDRAFRQALALQLFRRKVARLREPFLLIAGYGRSGKLLGRSFDALGRRFVVLDLSDVRIDDLELGGYHADVPGLVGDARDPGQLRNAGLHHPWCEGVLALTDDDEANLSVSMTAALLRPDLPVIARSTSPAISERMRAFGTPIVVNPFDSFGNRLRLALHAPASYQLMNWLESGPGADLPPRGRPPQGGRWILCGYGRFGRALTEDLRAEGLEVTIIEAEAASDTDDAILTGDASEPSVMARANLEQAVAFVAGTDNDTTNLSLVAAVRRINPTLFIVARQNKPASTPLFATVDIDTLLEPTEVAAREVYAQLSMPLLRRFLGELPALGDAWASTLIAQMTQRCGSQLQSPWKVRLTSDEAPAVFERIAGGNVVLGDLLRDPVDRDERLPAVPLLVLRGDESTLAPPDDFVLAAGDEILLLGWPAARRSLDSILIMDDVGAYVIAAEHVPASWIWRRLSHRQKTPVG
jgi:voltage-gated potassium channel